MSERKTPLDGDHEEPPADSNQDTDGGSQDALNGSAFTGLPPALEGLGGAINPQMLDQLAGLEMSEVVARISREEESRSRASADDSAAEHLEELADDMLNLLRRMIKVEEGQQTILTLLAQQGTASAQSARTIAREVDTLRRDMVGDRKHIATTSVFNELIPLIDRFQTMCAHLDGEADLRMRSQIEGVLDTLSACLRRLGCEEFAAASGSAFDPSRMQCEAYVDEGEPGHVAATVKPGYLFGEFVLRPATVTVTTVPPAANEGTGDESDE